MFVYQDARAPVEVAFTDRHGGVSGGPFASLDLAEPAADAADRGTDAESERAALEENLDIVAYALARGPGDPDDVGGAGGNPVLLPEGVSVPVLVRMRQVHGADVHTVDAGWLAERHDRPAVADALVTDLSGVILLVRVADCVPVLLADPGAGVVGAVHAGRPGLVAGVVPAAVARMRALGARTIVAWVGPHVCGACYEVPAAMREDVATAVPEAYAETSWGTPAVDVGAGVRAQLERAGVQVVDATRCTREDPDLYSYRRDGAAAGRAGGLVWIRP